MLQLISGLFCGSRSCDHIDHAKGNKALATYTDLYEDMFIAHRLWHLKGFQLPPLGLQKAFAVETVYYPTPIALHRAWKYMNATQMYDILKTAEI